MTIKLAVAIGLSVVSTGCLVTGARTIRQQLSAARMLADNGANVPQVDRTTLATGEVVDVETATMEFNNLLMRGIIGDQICFAQIWDFPGAFSREEATENGRGVYSRARFAFQTFDSLDQLAAETWPDPPATDKFSITLGDVDHEDGTCDALDEHCTMGWWHVNVGICAPIPTISPNAKYLALMIIGAKRNRVAVWELTGDAPPAASLDE